MDTCISNGDFKVDGRGRPVVINDFDEVLQRVMIRVKTRLGSFIYDRKLGSEIRSLKKETENLNNKALAIIREAIVDMSEVTADGASVTKDGDNMIINIEVSSGEENGEVELIV